MKSPDLNRFRVQKITKFETDPPTLRSPFVCCPWFALWLDSASSSALVRSLSSDCTSAFLTATLVLLPACHSASIPPAFRLHSRSAVPQLLDRIFIFSLSIFSRPYFCYSSFDSPGPPPKSSRCHPPRPSAAFWSESCSDYSSARRCRTLPTGKCASPVRKCHFQSVYKCLVEFSFVLRE